MSVAKNPSHVESNSKGRTIFTNLWLNKVITVNCTNLKRITRWSSSFGREIKRVWLISLNAHVTILDKVHVWEEQERVVQFRLRHIWTTGRGCTVLQFLYVYVQYRMGVCSTGWGIPALQAETCSTSWLLHTLSPYYRCASSLIINFTYLWKLGCWNLFYL